MPNAEVLDRNAILKRLVDPAWNPRATVLLDKDTPQHEPPNHPGTDTEKNLIYTGMGEDHPGLYRTGLFILSREEHWIREDMKLNDGESAKYLARIRYRQKLQSCTLHKKNEGLYLVFDQPQRGITPGQFAAWYDGEELVGSGVIN